MHASSGRFEDKGSSRGRNERSVEALAALLLLLCSCVPAAVDLDSLPGAKSSNDGPSASTKNSVSRGGPGAAGAAEPQTAAGHAAGTSGRGGSAAGRAAAGSGTSISTSAAAGRAAAGRAANAGSSASATSGQGLNGGAIGAPTRVTIDVTPALSLAEGPLWDPCEHRLLFVDVNASAIYALKDDNVTTFASNTNNANGIAFDLDGSLVLAQMGPYPGHLARLDKSGKITPIEPAGGPALHTPDDVVVRSDGTIYFSDGDFPPIGLLDFGQLPVYGLPPGGKALVNGGTVGGPNGVELSPDEKTLYVDAYFEGSVVKFDVARDGSLKKGAALATGLTNPDSLCLDADGNLYVGVSAGLQVIRPDGSEVKLIPVTSTLGVTNCTFGGDDGRTLYITAWTSLWKVDNMPVEGLDWVVNRKRLGCE